MKEEFKAHFRNVTRIMDCVGCDKCRLWGKVQTTGVATALKILFELDEKALEYAFLSSPPLSSPLCSLFRVRIGLIYLYMNVLPQPTHERESPPTHLPPLTRKTNTTTNLNPRRTSQQLQLRSPRPSLLVRHPKYRRNRLRHIPHHIRHESDTSGRAVLARLYPRRQPSLDLFDKVR